MPPTKSAARSFIVGETVHFRSRISLPGTKTPTDPATVELASMTLDGVETLANPVAFTRQAEGDFTLTLATDSLTPGTYQVTVRHADGVEKVTLVPDHFVLRAAS